MNKHRILLGAALSLAFISHAFAQAQLAPGQVMGNSTASQALANPSSINSILGRALYINFGGPTSTIKTFTLPNASDTLAALGQIQTWTGAQSFNDGKLILLGSSSGSATVKAPATGGGTATLFQGSDTIVGTSVSQTLTNKTFNCASNTCTVRVASDISGLGANVATWLGIPTSANLAAALTDETGSGAVVFATSPTLTTPVLGIASATSINKMAITAPATGSTLAVADGKTATINNSLTLAGTDATTITFQGSDTYVGRATTDTLTNKTINGTSNTLTVRLPNDVTGTLQATNFPALTGDIATTAGSLATTLATVNANVGSFGSGTAVPYLTVDAKGRVTAISTNAIPTASTSTAGLARCDGTTITCTSGVFTAIGAAASSIDAGGSTSVSNGADGDVLSIAAGKVSHQSPASVVAGVSIAPSKINNICYVDGVTHSSISSALTSCSSNSKIIVSINQTISSNIIASGDFIDIECVNGRTLTYNANVGISFTGASSGMWNCNLVGQGTGTSTVVPVLFNGGDQNFFIGNTVSGFGSTAQNGTILIWKGSKGFITGNVIKNVADFGINFIATSGSTIQGWTVQGNYVSNGIWGNTASGYTFAGKMTITGNNLDMGAVVSTTTTSCVQFNTTNGPWYDLTVTGNNCHFAGSVSGGGAEPYAFGRIFGFVFSGNHFNSRGYTTTTYLLELNGVSHATVDGNSFRAAGSGAAACIVLEGSSVAGSAQFVTISNNVCDGWETNGFGIGVIATGASQTIGNFQITGNVLNFPGSGTGFGVWVSTAGYNSTLRDFVIANNQAISDGAAGSTGVYIGRGGVGTVTNFVEGPNIFRAPATGRLYQTGVTNGCIISGYNGAATKSTLNGFTSSCL